METARKNSPVAMVRTQHQKHTVFADSGEFQVGKFPLGTRRDGGDDKSRYKDGVDNSARPIQQDARRGTLPLLYHLKLSGAVPVAFANRRRRKGRG